MLHALPLEIVTTICCFIRVNALARLRQTCKSFKGLDEWLGALFVPMGEWFELKDVGLAAKYMNWSQRVPSVRLSSLATMKHLAVWGSICDQEGRLLATFAPVLAPLYVDPLSICFTEDDDDGGPTLVYVTPEDIEFTWEDPALYTEFSTTIDTSSYVQVRGPLRYFRKQTTIEVYATAKLEDGVGVYKLVSGHSNPCAGGIIDTPEGKTWHMSHTELFFDSVLRSLSPVAFVHPDGLWFLAYDKTPAGLPYEWFDTFSKANFYEQLNLETTIVNMYLESGRGWNATRQDIIEQFVAYLQ